MAADTPYHESATNLIYNLLFCDDLELFKKSGTAPGYPFDILFSASPSKQDLTRITDDPRVDVRTKVLAWNRLRAMGAVADRKELLGVIVEVALDEGLDTLAAFQDGTARYINQSGKIIVWEAPQPTSDQLIADLLSSSLDIINRIGPWNQPRRLHPAAGMVRLTFLVSDGLYFGEGPMEVMFNDPMAGPALGAATQLLGFLTESAHNS